MNLSLKELNELIYCVGTVMTDKAGAYGEELRRALYEKLTTELESRVNDLVELERAPKQSTITEMPRYVRCIAGYDKAEVGKIYNTSDEKLADKLFSLSWEKVLLTFGNLKGVHNQVLHPRFESVDRDGSKPGRFYCTNY